MAYAIMRVKKKTTLGGSGGVAGVFEHALREQEVSNADRSKTNRVLVGYMTTADQVSERLASAVKRRDSVLALELFLGFSPDWAGNVDAWAKAEMKWLEKEFGVGNVAFAILHLDETTPHIQALVLPIRGAEPDVDGGWSGGKLNASYWLDGRKKLQALQDRHHAAVEHLGFERGVRGSTATHQELRRHYANIKRGIEDVQVRKSEMGDEVIMPEEDWERVRANHADLRERLEARNAEHALLRCRYDRLQERHKELRERWDDQDALDRRLNELYEKDLLNQRDRADDQD